MTEASYFGMLTLQFVDGKIKKKKLFKMFSYFFTL